MTPLTLKPVSIEQFLKKAAFIVCAVLFIAYAYFQARNLILGPSISLSTEPGILHEERSISIEGTAQNIKMLRLNGLEIHTDEAGVFNQTLVLENGYTIMTLEAEDRYGRTTTLTRPFVYKPV